MYCTESQVLVDLNFAASSRYHYAITQLALLAGSGNPEFFGDAKRQCEQCLQECSRTAAELERHRKTHGC